MPVNKTLPVRCDHSGPATVERAEAGYTVRCTVCRKLGPARRTPEAARKALLVLGVRDATATIGTGPDSRATIAPAKEPRG
jgi:hypothetical protein